MIRYVPFLKAKRGEITAVGELAHKVKGAICPLFDFPRKKPDYKSETYALTTRAIATGLKKHWGIDAEFYFDDYDIGQILDIAGQQQYAYVLKDLQGLQVIPVVSLGRPKHNAAVGSLKRNGEIDAATVAFRVEQNYFEDFDACEDQIDYDLAATFNEFESVDLILDCRLCSELDMLTTAQQIASFSRRFCAIYSSRRVIVTGSSIPGSLGDIVNSSTTVILARKELAILRKARALTDIELIGGDYATVSPFYSDAEFAPELFPRVTSPRLIYSFDHSHYIARGSSLASGGYGQYLGLTKALCGQIFFRGRDYSSGEDYFFGKSIGLGGNASNSTVVKPSVVSHITYMTLGARV